MAPALAELVSTTWDAGNAYFPPTTFQFSNIHAGAGAVNVVPGILTALFNFRFAPTSTVEGLTARVTDILARHGLNADVEWTISALPFLTERGPLVDRLAEVVHAVTGISPALSTDGGTSDARFMAAIAREVVEFGPLNETAHKVDECIRLADLGPLSRIYEGVLAALLS
jgi:succinyl-diaminopimelate desuccinylase